MRRAHLLLHSISGMFVGALVLGVCVPLFISARRHADVYRLRTRTVTQAREISARFGEDVRQAREVTVSADGGGLRLVLERLAGGADVVTYRRTAEGLVRELRPGAGRSPERLDWGSPFSRARFGREGKAVTARLEFRGARHGREVRLEVDCRALPRSRL